MPVTPLNPIHRPLNQPFKAGLETRENLTITTTQTRAKAA